MTSLAVTYLGLPFHGTAEGARAEVCPLLIVDIGESGHEWACGGRLWRCWVSLASVTYYLLCKKGFWTGVATLCGEPLRWVLSGRANGYRLTSRTWKLKPFYQERAGSLCFIWPSYNHNVHHILCFHSYILMKTDQASVCYYSCEAHSLLSPFS